MPLYTYMNLRAKFYKLRLFSLLAIATSGLQAEPQYLSESERQALQEKLEDLLNSAENSSKQRFSKALGAFKSAIQSDTAAHELYLVCHEKVNFIDKQKSSQDFREWKRKHKERGDLSEFRRALRHQLNWLLLSIQVSVRPDDIYEFGGQAVQKIDTVISELTTLKSQKSLLRQDVLNSVYAKAFDINGLEAEGWPSSPVDVASVYEDVVMPPLRDSANIATLRASWDKRIKQIGLIKKEWSDKPDKTRIGLKKNQGAPGYEAWLDNEYLKLLWDKEKDCFETGDQVNASNNMLSHIQKNISHKLSLEWVKEFQKITGINGEKEVKASATVEE